MDASPFRMPSHFGHRAARLHPARWWRAAWPIAAVLVAIAAPARAGLVVEVAPVAASPGSVGSFDVLLVNTNATGGDSYAVSSDTVVLGLSDPVGVTITGVTTATAVPYIYQLPLSSLGGGFVTDLTATGFTAGDSEFQSPPYDVVAPGRSYGLAHVTYSVAVAAVAGTSGTISLVGTNLADVNGDPVSVTPAEARFMIATVPEPSSLVLVAIGLLAPVISRGLRRKPVAR